MACARVRPTLTINTFADARKVVPGVRWGVALEGCLRRVYSTQLGALDWMADLESNGDNPQLIRIDGELPATLG